MIGFQFFLFGNDLTVTPDIRRGKRSIELDYKIIFKVRSNTSRIFRSISYYRIFFGDHLYIRTVIKGVDHNIRTIAFRKCKAKCRRTFGRGQFCRNIMVCKIYTIIIRCSNLCFMRKPTGSLLLSYLISDNRH